MLQKAGNGIGNYKGSSIITHFHERWSRNG